MPKDEQFDFQEETPSAQQDFGFAQDAPQEPFAHTSLHDILSGKVPTPRFQSPEIAIKEAGGGYDKEDSMGKLHRLLDAAREVRNMSPKALNALKSKIANDMDEAEYDFVMGLIQKLQHDPFYELD